MSYAMPITDRNGPLARRLRVLVADDDEINTRILVHILLGLGHEARGACSGLQALRELTQGHFDVLFLDLHMPDMGGLEATRFILNTWSPEERPKIVGLTADTMQQGRATCLAAGMDEFMSKPVGIGAVRGVLDHLIQPSERLGLSPTHDL